MKPQTKRNIVLSCFFLLLISTSFMFEPIRNLAILFGEFIAHRKIDNNYWHIFFIQNCISTDILLVFLIIIIKHEIKDFTNIFIACILYFFIISNLKIMWCKNFVGFSNQWDYGDLLNFIDYYSNQTNLYSTNYPPFAVLIYKLFSFLLPLDSSVVTEYALNYILLMYLITTTIPCFILFYMLTSDDNKLIFSLAFFLSSPMLFAYQRANIIIYALIFLLVFLRFYSSKNKVLKEIALLSLAISANIKLYPAIFGIVLLKEKKINEAVRCAAYGIILFIIPAFFSEHNNFFLFDFINSLSSFAGNDSSSIVNSGSMSISAILIKLFLQNKILPLTQIDNMLTGIVLIYIFFTLTLVMMAEKKFEILFMLASLCMFVPTISYWYSTIFLIPSFIMFIQENKKKKYDIVILVLYILTFAYIYGSIFFAPHKCYTIICLYFIISLDIIYNSIKNKRFIVLFENNI